MPVPSGPIRQAIGNTNTATSLVVTLPANPAATSTILVLVTYAFWSSGITVLSVAGLGASWSKLIGVGSSDGLEWWVGVAPNGASAGVTVTMNAGGTLRIEASVSEWGNLDPTLLASAAGVWTPPSGPGAQTPIVPTNNNALVIWGYDVGGAPNWPVNSGYTALTAVNVLRASYRIDVNSQGTSYGAGIAPDAAYQWLWAGLALQGSPLPQQNLSPGPHTGLGVGGGIASLSGVEAGPALLELALYSGASPTTRLAGLHRAHDINWRDALAETGSGSFRLPTLPQTTIEDETNATNTNLSGNLLVVTGTARTLFPSCDLTVPPAGAVNIGWNVWWSHSNSGTFKRETVSVRRDTVNGAVLATFSTSATSDGGDSVTGHQLNWAGSFVDTAPTTGRYVLTVQEIGGGAGNPANTQIWSDARTFVLGVDAQQVTDVSLADNIVRCHVNGRFAFAFLADAPTHTVASSDGPAGESWTVAGRQVEAYLDREQWYPPGWGTGGPNFPTKVTGALTGGGWLRRFVDEAKARGGLPALTTDFNSSVDSNGVPWATTLTLEFAVGTRGLALVDELRRNGITVRVTEALVLRAYQTYGEHRETSVVLRQGAHIREAVPVAYGTSELRTRMLVQGTEVGGLAPFTEIADTALETPEVGRRSGFTTGDGRTALDAAQATTTSIPVALLHGLGPGQFLAGFHFNVGDWVGLDIPGTFERATQRVVAVVVSQADADSVPRFDVTLGSTRRHPLLDLASRVGKLER